MDRLRSISSIFNIILTLDAGVLIRSHYSVFARPITFRKITLKIIKLTKELLKFNERLLRLSSLRGRCEKLNEGPWCVFSGSVRCREWQIIAVIWTIVFNWGDNESNDRIYSSDNRSPTLYGSPSV